MTKKLINFENYFISILGIIYNKKNEIRKTQLDSDGYENIFLFKNGKRFTRKVHRLVAQTFIPNLNNKLEVNHINGIKTDNNMENLEWCTRSENEKHAHKIGLKTSPGKNKFGKLNGNAKPVQQLTLTGKIIKSFDCVADVKRELGFDISFICKVCKNKKQAYGYNWRYC